MSVNQAMRILFGLPACDYSVSDVARGLRAALVRQGHVVEDYSVSKRMAYHARAMGPDYRDQIALVSQQASQDLLLQATYHRADLVIVVSALIYHPIAIHALRYHRVPLAVVHTESPYEDVAQAEWASAYPEALHCTHDRVSAERLGWAYLPHAYDPAIHRPCHEVVTPRLFGGEVATEWNNAEDQHGPDVCDVLFLGTGWPERIALLEAVDWTGIDLRLRGVWPALSESSPLRRYYHEGLVPNVDAVRYYRAARVNLNIHRAGQGAVSLNPRGYELAACGAFEISDYREEGVSLFGDSVPRFETAEELGRLVRQYLADPASRARLAIEARTRVRHETFDARAEMLMTALSHRRETAA